MSDNPRPDAWPSGLIIVDKPTGMTSHDVVARMRRVAHTRRVGHAGTLDPMATGVLVIGIEKATRLLGHLTLTRKTYEATIRLGQSTTTDDAEGQPTGGNPARGVSAEALEEEIAKLTGEILQVPSSVSAIKVNGERAYKLTRAGQAPELAARPVTVYEFTVTAIRPVGDYLDLDATISCSSGTYIRALARDLGTALATGGHLTALRRTAVGPYTLTHAHTLKDLEAQAQNQSSERVRLTPTPPAPAPAAGVPATASAPDAAPAPAPAPAPDAAPAPAPAPAPGVPRASSASPAPGGSVVPWVIPLAEAAAAAFPGLDLTAEEARRLAQGARIPLKHLANLPPWPTTPNPSGAVAPSDEPIGAGGHGARSDITLGATALQHRDEPLAAFAPDGSLVALVTAEGGLLRSVAVFVDAAAGRVSPR